MHRSRLLPALLLGAIAMTRLAHADAVVGTGTPASCTEAALDAALLAGGTITFNCGSTDTTIGLTTPKTISTTVALDGGGRIVLSGQNAVLPFTVMGGGSLTLQGLTIADGLSPGDGGCLLNLGGALSLVDAIIDHCSAPGTGGAICNGAGSLGLQTVTIMDTHAGTNGGAIYNAQSLTMDDIFITECSAARGGGLYNASGTATLTSTAIDGNTATLDGGGIYNAIAATLNMSTGSIASEIADNMATSPGMTTTGGGLRNDGNATLTGLWVRNNQAVNGGGIANVSGTLTVSAVTLSLNSAVTGSGGGLDNSATANFTNSTFTTNTAALAGGGIIQRGGTVSLLHTTMLDDGAPTGGAIDRTGGTVSLRSSVLAAASGGCCAGGVTSNGNNVASDVSCALAAGGDQSPTSPQLAALGFNTGPTPTCLPQTGSPVIDTATGPGCPATDQRGRTRPSGPACDVGAVEVGTTTSTSTSTSSSSTTSTSTSSSTSTSHSTTTSSSTSTSTSHTTSTSSSTSTSHTTTTTSTSPTTSTTIPGTTSSTSSSSTSTTHSTTSTSISSSSTLPGGSTTSTSLPGGSTTSTSLPGGSTTTTSSSTSSTLSGGSTTSTSVPGGSTTSTSLPNGSTTSSSTSSTLPGGSTTSTSLPGGSTTSSTTVTTTSVTFTTVTTSSTIPDPCAGVPAGATFLSIACRLDELDVEISALGSVTPRAPKLRDRLSQATELATDASVSCAASDTKTAKKALKGSFKKLGRLRKLLKASKTIPTQAELLSTVDGLRDDVRALRATLACPIPATVAP